MTIPAVQYVATAGQKDFDVPFPYIEKRHVGVLVNGTLVPVLEWVNDVRLRIDTPLAGGETLLVYRDTPIEQQIVQFQNGAILTQEDLNLAVLQLLYKEQEMEALYGRVLGGAFGRPETDPQAVVEEMANLVLEQEVLNNFRQRIADIDLTAAALAQQAVAITEAATSTADLDARLAQLRIDHTALAGVVDALGDLGDGSGIAALIQSEKDARIDGDTALAATIALIGAKSGTSNAFILDIDNVKVSPTESLSQRFTAIASSVGSGDYSALTALIQQEAETRADAISAEATARTSLAATLRGETDTKLAAAITTAQNAWTAGDAAEATARNNLAATLRGETDTKITAAITTEQNARISGDSAEAQARTTLAATLRSETAASIQSEAQARINQDGVFTSLFTLLGAKNPAGTAFILDESKVQLTGGVALGSRLSGIDTSIGNVSASIVSQINTEVTNRNSAIASATNVLAAQIASSYATIGSLSSVSANVNGLLARYGVSLDVNGYVTGFVQNNNGTSGSFVVLANRFAVVMPGANPTVPFEVSNGNVYINGQRITPGSVSADRLSVTSLSALTANIGFLVSYNGLGGRVERDGNGTRIYRNNGSLAVKMGF